MLKCDYCKSVVKEGKTKCPHCGSNLTTAYEKRDKEKAKLLKENQQILKERTKGVIDATSKSFGIFRIVSFLIMLSAIGAIIYIGTKSANLEIPVIDSKKEEKQQVLELNDTAKLKNKEIIVDKYEAYEYKTDIKSFTTDIAQEGYQQMAFHIKEKNISKEKITSDSQVTINLLADGIQMEHSGVKCDKNIMIQNDMCKTFKNFNLSFIVPGGTYDGWIGFYVDKKAKKLELKVGSYVTYELDNPYYEN